MNIKNLKGFETRELYGQRKVEFPLQDCPNHKIITCSYMGAMSDYERRLQSSAFDEDATFILVNESISKIEGDAVWFERRYSNIPESWADSSTMAFQYPGMDDNIGGALYQRNPFTYTTPVKVVKEYFLTSAPYGTGGITILQPVLFMDAFTLGKLEFIPFGSTSYYLSKLNTFAVAEPSSIERYQGDIWCRTTNYILVR